ncbi:MAG: type VI secretion system tip protein VgrG [Gemmatirosa sp.]|nr:type VI secretion system tip protein VgrG [Gemmatirosa sp.]
MFTVTTPLGASTFTLTALSGEERLSDLYELRLEVLADSTTTVAFDRLLGQPITVTLSLADGTTKRYLSGVARSVAQGPTTRGQNGFSRTAYRLMVVPALWLLTRRAQSRVFQQLGVPDILKKVLVGMTTRFELKGTYEPRNYCTQYRETDFAFASRLMEEEGIYYFFEHTASGHTMVIADTPVSHPDVPGPTSVRFDVQEGGVRDEGVVTGWEKSQEVTSGKVTLWDHTFELPSSQLDATAQVPASVTLGTVSHKLRVANNDALELYDFPGGYAKRFDGTAPGGGERASDVQKIFTDNARTVKLRSEEVEVSALLVQGEGTTRQFAAGHKFTLTNHADANGDYVLTSVQHEARIDEMGAAGQEVAYANRFACIPAALPFRPARRTARPHVAGCQTAVVVGPSGEEIFTDKYGRVKVQFHWDREGKKDASSSCWVRVATMWAGRQWGAVHLPRIGQEVVVDFLEGDPDAPIITGSVYNADQMPPYALPANKTQSGVKSRSSPKGSDENFNELRFEDKKDSEHVYLHAEKDLQTVVENDETRSVGHDRTTTVASNDTRTVGGKDKNGNDVGGDDTIVVVKGKREITVKEKDLITTVTKGDLKTTVSEGDESHVVSKGNQSIKVETGNRTVNVKTDDTTIVQSGNRQVTVKQGFSQLTVEMGKLSLQAKQGDISIKADAGKITIEAGQMIELKVGSVSIKLSASGITMVGPTFKVAATGAAEIQGAVVKMEGQGMLTVKSPMAQVNGDGMLMMKGGVTMIN